MYIGFVKCKNAFTSITTHRYIDMKTTLVSLQTEINALRAELDSVKTELASLKTQPKALRTPGTGVRDYGPASTRKMDDVIAWRIMFGDLKATSVKDIANNFGLSRGQIYSVRGHYTFTHLKADKAPEGVVQTTTAEQPAA